jgi:hypothetical protein
MSTLITSTAELRRGSHVATYWAGEDMEGRFFTSGFVTNILNANEFELAIFNDENERDIIHLGDFKTYVKPMACVKADYGYCSTCCCDGRQPVEGCICDGCTSFDGYKEQNYKTYLLCEMNAAFRDAQERAASAIPAKQKSALYRAVFAACLRAADWELEDVMLQQLEADDNLRLVFLYGFFATVRKLKRRLRDLLRIGKKPAAQFDDDCPF